MELIVRVWKWVLSQIDKIEGFEHIYKLVNNSTYYQLVLGWNLIWIYIHDSIFMA